MSFTVATECPPLYDLRNDTYKSCYMFVGDYLTWYEAELYCKTTGGHLVGLETSDEQEFLIDYVQRSNSEYHTGFVLIKRITNQLQTGDSCSQF